MFLIVCKYLIPKGYRGLTVFPFVFISQQSEKHNAVLIHHERIHLRQQMELLVLPFFVWYAIEFLLKFNISGIPFKINSRNLVFSS